MLTKELGESSLDPILVIQSLIKNGITTYGFFGKKLIAHTMLMRFVHKNYPDVFCPKTFTYKKVAILLHQSLRE
jgi:hypothetical protein